MAAVGGKPSRLSPGPRNVVRAALEADDRSAGGYRRSRRSGGHAPGQGTTRGCFSSSVRGGSEGVGTPLRPALPAAIAPPARSRWRGRGAGSAEIARDRRRHANRDRISSSRSAARPAAGKPGRWTNPAAYARRSAPEADFSCLRSAYRGTGYLPRRGGPPRRIRQPDQWFRRCPAGPGARPRGGALPCYKSWPRDEARLNVLTRETSIGKPNRRSTRCRYQETAFRSRRVPGSSGPAQGMPSSSRPVPGLPSVPRDSSAAASSHSRSRRSGGSTQPQLTGRCKRQ